jgi:predicted thioesterase
MYPGLAGKSEMVVTEKDLVTGLGGMDIETLSTPRLIQLLEAAALNAIQGILPPDQISLGRSVRIDHLSPTPPGKKVRAHAMLKEIRQNRLVFRVDAWDESDKIAEGEHERVIVSRERFFQKIERKKNLHVP